MKRRAFLISMCFLIFFLTSCSQNSNQSSKNVSANTTSSNLKKSTRLKGQDVSDITKLSTPDELVFLHDGVKTTFAKENPKFKKIIQLNNKRQTRQTGACKCIIDFNDVAKNGDYLIYNYTNTNYVPVYFKLVPSPDKFENWAMNNYGSNIPSDEKDVRTKINAFGPLAPAGELLSYLKN